MLDTSHSCDPGLILAPCHIWVEYLVGFRLAPRVFLQFLWFSSLHKTSTANSNSTKPEDPHKNQLKADLILL